MSDFALIPGTDSSDQAGAERAALWQLLKVQVRIVRDLRARATYWRTVATQRAADINQLDREIRTALGAPDVAGKSCVELAAELCAERDAVARVSDVREDEIVALGYELERTIAARDGQEVA